jgi:hypothetical protein
MKSANGAPGPKVCEHPRGLNESSKRIYRGLAGTTSKNYSVRWKEPKIDVAELARLRFLEGWETKELSKRYGRPAITIGNWCRRLRFDKFCHGTISPEKIQMQKEYEEAQKKKMDEMKADIGKSAQESPLNSLKAMDLPETAIQNVEAKLQEEAKTKIEAIQGTYYETYD